HDLGALQRLVQALPRDQVDAGGRRRGDGLMSGCGQLVDHLRADQPGTADDCELHGSHLSWRAASTPGFVEDASPTRIPLVRDDTDSLCPSQGGAALHCCLVLTTATDPRRLTHPAISAPPVTVCYLAAFRVQGNVMAGIGGPGQKDWPAVRK